MGVIVATRSNGFSLSTTKGSGKAESIENSVGIYLPEFETMGLSVGDFSEAFLGLTVSKGARELLHSVSPAGFCPTRGHKKGLIMVEGRSIKKDPSTDEVRRFSLLQGWFKPSVEDAFYQAKSITLEILERHSVTWVAIMHEPVQGAVLAITSDGNKKLLIARKAEPREGWFAREGAFAFRPPYPTTY